MMLKIKPVTLLLAAMMCAALIGCAGPDEPVQELEVTEAAPEPVEYTVVMTEFAFEPATQTVPAGAEVTLILPNEGTLIHSYYLMELGYEVTAPFDTDDEAHVLEEIEVEVGEEGTLTFTAPSEPGTYQVICHEAGHMEAGMIGEFTVTE